MEFAIRYARADEFAKVLELDGASFGIDYGEADLTDAALDIDPTQVLAAVEGDDRFVGISAELPLSLTMPGGADVTAMGVTWVSVELTRRRRGILRALVETQLRDHAERGFSATILGASEGGIYGRFGFGVASHQVRTVVDRRRAALAEPADASQVRRVSTDEARTLLPGLYDRWRAQTPGAVGIPPSRWAFIFSDFEHQRRGMTKLAHLVHPDGYVSYRLKSDWGDGDPQSVCALVQYAPITPQAHGALWQTLLAMDLVATIESPWIPLDDPLPWLLTDRRRARAVAHSDATWVRPLDVCALLAARTYGIEVDLVLAVDDALLGGGRYRLRGGPEGGSCTRTERAADVHLGMGALGAISLGGTRVGQLARAGLVHADEQSALVRLDRAMLSDRAPAQGAKI